MKQCPNCRTTYTDDTLSYCLADGTLLVPATDEQPTQVRSGIPSYGEKTAEFGKPDQMRIEIGGGRTDQIHSPAMGTVPVQAKSGSGLIRIVAILAVLLVLILLVVGGAGLLVYLNVPKDPIVSNTNKAPTPVPTRSQNPANDNDELRDQIANLQRQLDDQKKKAGVNNVPLTIPTPTNSTTTAKANSPSDGFLALRNLPSTDIGDRIAKIPHGATITIGACGPVIRSGSKSGRWCQAKYNGMTGWVFDAYLIY